MKKFLLTAIIGVLSVASFASVKVGGDVGVMPASGLESKTFEKGIVYDLGLNAKYDLNDYVFVGADVKYGFLPKENVQRLNAEALVGTEYMFTKEFGLEGAMGLGYYAEMGKDLTDDQKKAGSFISMSPQMKVFYEVMDGLQIYTKARYNMDITSIKDIGNFKDGNFYRNYDFSIGASYSLEF